MIAWWFWNYRSGIFVFTENSRTVGCLFGGVNSFLVDSKGPSSVVQSDKVHFFSLEHSSTYCNIFGSNSFRTILCLWESQRDELQPINRFDFALCNYFILLIGSSTHPCNFRQPPPINTLENKANTELTMTESRAVTRDIFSATIGSVCCCYVGQPFDTGASSFASEPSSFNIVWCRVVTCCEIP